MFDPAAPELQPRQLAPDEVPGPVIARGATADIHAWGADHVLKLFHTDYVLETVQYEAYLARQVVAAGLPVPPVGDVIALEGRHGLIYSRAAGMPLLQRLEAKPWRLLAYARRMARLHAEIHQHRSATLPDQHARLRESLHEADLTPALRDRLLTRLAQLPTGETICHGDFHLENILQDDAAYVVIDWIDASRGHPLGDVARSYVLMAEIRDDADPGNRLIHWGPRRWFRNAYLREYFRLRPGSWADLKPWLPVVAAARLREQAAQGKNLAALAVRWLAQSAD